MYEASQKRQRVEPLAHADHSHAQHFGFCFWQISTYFNDASIVSAKNVCTNSCRFGAACLGPKMASRRVRHSCFWRSIDTDGQCPAIQQPIVLGNATDACSLSLQAGADAISWAKNRTILWCILCRITVGHCTLVLTTLWQLNGRATHIPCSCAKKRAAGRQHLQNLSHSYVQSEQWERPPSPCQEDPAPASTSSDRWSARTVARAL